MVPTAQGSAAALVAGGTVTGATLPPALVSLTVPGFGTLGVAQVFFMTRHLLPVSATPALLLHLLSAGFAAPSVTPHGTGVLQTCQTAIARVAAWLHFLCTRQGRLGLSAWTRPADGARTWRTVAITAHLLTGVVPTGEGSTAHLLAGPAGAGAGPL